jgi:putative oxidoreductase
MKKRIVLEIICFLLVSLMLYASVSRMLDFHTFIDDINNQPLPNSLTQWLVYGIPGLQVLTALLLIFERTRMAGLALALVITSFYILYNILILTDFFGRIPCTCGGMIKHLSWQQHLVFSVFFAGVSLAGILLMRKPMSRNNRITADRAI